ncbi:MAG TPA: aldo/keto reductase [Bacteroidales bacterium]|nr:aldo/keto reductase [Bacteroidales bacterium]
MTYSPSSTRYSNGMKYSLCGKSGLLLPKISLGLWHNFGHTDNFENSKSIVEYAFDQGVTHFDLANNYGPPPGSAEENFGKIFRSSLATHRDEIIVSTKAGHLMWNGPYGDGSSRKNLISSLNQSLKRMDLEYVDIFYSHRYDGVTPIEETMQALIDIVKSGKALYAGISKYPPELAEKCYRMLESQGVRCLIYQDRYSMLAREVENGALETAERNGIGFSAFSPLAQGLLTDRYLNGIPSDSRVAKNGFLKKEQVTPERIAIIRELNALSLERGESLAQMALSWLLNDARVTTVIVGASSVQQLKNNLEALQAPAFELDVLAKIREIVSHYPTDSTK